jgi:hypothetical protein
MQKKKAVNARRRTDGGGGGGGGRGGGATKRAAAPSGGGGDSGGSDTTPPTKRAHIGWAAWHDALIAWAAAAVKAAPAGGRRDRMPWAAAAMPAELAGRNRQQISGAWGRLVKAAAEASSESATPLQCARVRAILAALADPARRAEL